MFFTVYTVLLCTVNKLQMVENLPCVFVLLPGKLKGKMLNFQLYFSMSINKVHGCHTILPQQ